MLGMFNRLGTQNNIHPSTNSPSETCKDHFDDALSRHSSNSNASYHSADSIEQSPALSRTSSTLSMNHLPSPKDSVVENLSPHATSRSPISSPAHTIRFSIKVNEQEIPYVIRIYPKMNQHIHLDPHDLEKIKVTIQDLLQSTTKRLHDKAPKNKKGEPILEFISGIKFSLNQYNQVVGHATLQNEKFLHVTRTIRFEDLHPDESILEKIHEILTSMQNAYTIKCERE